MFFCVRLGGPGATTGISNLARAPQAGHFLEVSETRMSASMAFAATGPSLLRPTRLQYPILATAAGGPPQGGPLSPQLLVVDSGALLLWSLVVSSVNLFEKAYESASESFPIVFDLQQLPLNLMDVAIEYSGAVCLALAWLVAGAWTGALEESWFDLDKDEHGAAPLGIARLARAWIIAVPLFAVAKALGVVGIMLPLGNGLTDVLALPVSWPTAIDHVAGMLLVVTLCRRLLLQRRGMDV